MLRELYRIRLAYAPQASPEELAAWETLGPGPLSDPRIVATKQLADAMKDTAAARGRPLGWLAAAAAAVFLLGGLTAWLTMRQPPLVSAAHSGPGHLPKQTTVIRQWYLASQIGTQEAWQSVIDYFPDKQYYVLRAKQQLARIYLRQRDYPPALATFDALAAAPDQDREFRAFGLAGKCLVLTLLKRYRESADVLEELWSCRQDLKDWQMRRMLDYVIRENRSKLGPQTGAEWDVWLNEQFHPEG
jgi:hypothetical protein